MEGGILMFPLVLITLVVLGIVLRALWHLFARRGSDTAAVQSCLDGLLFWGWFAVVIGLLGSAVGYNKAMTAIVNRGLLHPKLLWIGTAEGMVSSIAGLLVLMLAGACWYLLRWRFLSLRRPAR